MIRGEGAEEKLSYSFISRNDPPESDDGDELSNYSSCGGESPDQYERYCSASSAMGTPSFVTSASFQESDSGSLKNFNLGDGNGFFRGSSAGRKLSDSSGLLGLGGEMDGVVGTDGNLDEDDDWRSRVTVNGDSDGAFLRSMGFSDESGKVDVGVQHYTRIEDGKFSDDQGEESSRCEYSDGEDSMYGYDGEHERKIEFCGRENARGEGSEKNENNLVLNSRVAFGDDDWDDFVEQIGEKDVDFNMWSERQNNGHGDLESSSLGPASSVEPSNVASKEQERELDDTPKIWSHFDSDGKSPKSALDLSTTSTHVVDLDARVHDKEPMVASSNQVSDIDELVEYLGNSSHDYDIFKRIDDLPNEESSMNLEFKAESDTKNTAMATSEVTAIRHNVVSVDNRSQTTKIEVDPHSDPIVNHQHLVQLSENKGREVELIEGNSSSSMPSFDDPTMNPSTKNGFAFSFDEIKDHFVPSKKPGFELNDVYDEIVNDMEDILLDSVESPQLRFPHGSTTHHAQLLQPSRDGGSSASTSGTDYAYNWTQQPVRIDRIEVIGARQVKGNVSFSERLVGVQKYTVYKIRAWSGEEHWEVERRYRDFSTLYFRLKKLFADHGLTLPSPWSAVEKETRKLFGNASPDVISERSNLIQGCLQSITHPKYWSISLNALSHFLSQSNDAPDSPASDTNRPQLSNLFKDTHTYNISPLGKTISLIVDIRPLKPVKQILDAQHYRCSGCHKNFDDERTTVQELVRSLGWGKPRLCEYSGQLFCSSCHNNDTAVLPARVLHYWDFTHYPVSQMAKSFLDSVQDKPMLCVSAVNPFLFSKVPTLQHVASVRNRIRSMLPYVRCPFRRSIDRGLGSRSYLLDSNDFFALRDLIDLSKGLFSALPVMVETVCRKIEEHITEQCLVCYDVGVQCSARQNCDSPLSLIFPFQEGVAEKCKSCDLIFHKNCLTKIPTCPCGARLRKEETRQGTKEDVHNVNLMVRTAESSSNGMLSGLYSKLLPGRSLSLRNQDKKVGNNVILMDSLSNSSL